MLAVSASAATVTFRPNFAPNSQLGQGSIFTTELTLSGSEYGGNVSPLTELRLHLPAGTSTSAAGFATCSEATLNVSGPAGCPANSTAGAEGSMELIVSFGTEHEPEELKVKPIFGPNGALYFYLTGTTPVSIETIMEGHYIADSSPYGEELVLSIPLIETVPGAPYASITALTLHVGAFHEEGGVSYHSVTVPSTCPGSFDWAADAVMYKVSQPLDVSYVGSCPGASNQEPTGTILQVSNTTLFVGERVTYTATVTPTELTPPPTGFIAFYDNGVPDPGCGAVKLTQGIASSTAGCETSYSATGSHEITASYGGDTDYLSSVSGPRMINVVTSILPGGGNAPPGVAGPMPVIAPVVTPPVTTPAAGISSVQLQNLLRTQLTPAGKASKIATILKSGGYSSTVTAPESGSLLIQWYQVPSGAKLSKKIKAKPTLVASGKTTFAGAGGGKITVKLTPAGKRLLKHSKSLKLVAKGTFTPTGQSPVIIVKSFVA
jgi:hypothetical protein